MMFACVVFSLVMYSFHVFNSLFYGYINDREDDDDDDDDDDDARTCTFYYLLSYITYFSCIFNRNEQMYYTRLMHTSSFTMASPATGHWDT